MKYRLVYTNKIYELEAEQYTKVLNFRLDAEKYIGLMENSTILFYRGPLEERLNLYQVGTRPDTTILVFSRHGSSFELSHKYQSERNSSPPDAKVPITNGNCDIFSKYEKQYKCSYSQPNTISNLYKECKGVEYNSSPEFKYIECSICTDKNIKNLISCRKCSKNYHIKCLPMLPNHVTERDWVCHICQKDNELNSIIKTLFTSNSDSSDSDSEYFYDPLSLNYSIKNDNITLEPKSPSISSDIISDNLYQNKSNENGYIEHIKDLSPSKKARSRNKFYIGKIPGVPVGTSWDYRIEVAKAGVHRPHVAGISGNQSEGSESIVLAGGYIDDEDYGDEFIYTGSGGDTAPMSDSNKKENQELTRSNYALALNCDAQINNIDGAEAQDWKKSRPIRVVRSFKMKKHNPGFAPLSGNRYDGLYKLVSYYPERSKHNNGSFVWRFYFRRDDTEPAPWTREGIERSKNLGIRVNAQLNEPTQFNNILTSVNGNPSCKNSQRSNKCKTIDINGISDIISKNAVIKSNSYKHSNTYDETQSTVFRQTRLDKNQKSKKWSESHNILFGSSASFSPSSSVCHAS